MAAYDALSGERAHDESRLQMGEQGDTAKTGKRNRVTISLSDKSVRAFRELKEATDADSDSEVFRNALRLYLALLRAHREGKTVLLRDEKQGIVYPIELFLPAN